MKKRIISTLGVVLLGMTLVFGGCSSNRHSTVYSSYTNRSNDVKEEKSEEKVSEEVSEAVSEEEINQEVAKIVVNWDNSEATVFDEYDPKAFEDGQIGAMIIKPYFSSDLISSGELEAGSECTLSDADGNVVAVQKLEQDGGKMTYTCTLYSLDYDFSIEGEPATPFNNSVIDTATADITQAGESDIHYVYEDMYVRSYTGVYFLGICTCENGKIGTWIVPEYMMSSYQNIDEGVWPKNHMK